MMIQTIAQNIAPDTITAFQAWCSFIESGLQAISDNDDTLQAIQDDEKN